MSAWPASTVERRTASSTTIERFARSRPSSTEPVTRIEPGLEISPCDAADVALVDERRRHRDDAVGEARVAVERRHDPAVPLDHHPVADAQLGGAGVADAEHVAGDGEAVLTALRPRHLGQERAGADEPLEAAGVDGVQRGGGVLGPDGRDAAGDGLGEGAPAEPLERLVEHAVDDRRAPSSAARRSSSVGSAHGTRSATRRRSVIAWFGGWSSSR